MQKQKKCIILFNRQFKSESHIRTTNETDEILHLQFYIKQFAVIFIGCSSPFEDK